MPLSIALAAKWRGLRESKVFCPSSITRGSAAFAKRTNHSLLWVEISKCKADLNEIELLSTLQHSVLDSVYIYVYVFHAVPVFVSNHNIQEPRLPID